MYYSDYGRDALTEFAARLAGSTGESVPAWCIFDNTMSAAATGNALAVRDLLAASA
jgi:uncharacterized protein YecE (DUF72 family)